MKFLRSAGPLTVTVVVLAIVAIAGLSLSAGACAAPAQGDLMAVASERGLSPEDAARALKTYVPTGGRDEFLLFGSGGQAHPLG